MALSSAIFMFRCLHGCRYIARAGSGSDTVRRTLQCISRAHGGAEANMFRCLHGCRSITAPRQQLLRCSIKLRPVTMRDRHSRLPWRSYIARAGSGSENSCNKYLFASGIDFICSSKLIQS